MVSVVGWPPHPITVVISPLLSFRSCNYGVTTDRVHTAHGQPTSTFTTDVLHLSVSCRRCYNRRKTLASASRRPGKRGAYFCAVSPTHLLKAPRVRGGEASFVVNVLFYNHSKTFEPYSALWIFSAPNNVWTSDIPDKCYINRRRSASLKVNDWELTQYHIIIIIIIIIIGTQPLGRSGQRPEFSQATGMALVRCILRKFLGVACHCFPPLFTRSHFSPPGVSTSATTWEIPAA